MLQILLYKPYKLIFLTFKHNTKIYFKNFNYFVVDVIPITFVVDVNFLMFFHNKIGSNFDIFLLIFKE